MKKLFLILIIFFTFCFTYGQNVFKQRVDALKGINVTGTININSVPLTSNKVLNYDTLVAQRGDTISIDEIITIPTIYSAAGDTSNVPVPGKIGNIFINTSAGKVYISKSAIRNGWVILN